jgi:hypothetical protein
LMTPLFASYSDHDETAAPANPPAGVVRTYFDSSSHTGKCLTSTGGDCTPKGFALSADSSNVVQTYGLSATLNSCSMDTLWHNSQGSSRYSYDGVVGCVHAPTGSTTYQVNGITGYALADSAGSNAVAMYGYAQCNATGAKSWGANPSAKAAAGALGADIQGVEVDVTIGANAGGGAVKGVSVPGLAWDSVPGLATGYNLGAPTGTSGAAWTYGYTTQNGATTAGGYGLYLASVAGTSGSNSQRIGLQTIDSSAVNEVPYIYGNASSAGSAGIVLNPIGNGSVATTTSFAETSSLCEREGVAGGEVVEHSKQGWAAASTRIERRAEGV